MIRYRLQCEKGHQFEAWFKSSTAYDRQVKRGLVNCADCGSAEVSKAIMAPAVSSGTKSSEVTIANRQAAASSTKQAELLALMRRIRAEVENNAEYVGPKFAEEARKIHYEEVEARGIYGEASLEEAQSLQEEGIDFYPLPKVPEDNN
jgi:hypothetical protein